LTPGLSDHAGGNVRCEIHPVSGALEDGGQCSQRGAGEGAGSCSWFGAGEGAGSGSWFGAGEGAGSGSQFGAGEGAGSGSQFGAGGRGRALRHEQNRDGCQEADDVDSPCPRAIPPAARCTR
jgi:hypothetical protein